MPANYNDPVVISQYYDNIARNKVENTYSSLTQIDRSNAVKADARAYQRQAELNRLAMVSTTMSVATDIGMWSTASAGMTAAGATGATAFFGPMALTALPAAFVGKVTGDYIDKQRRIHSIASDIDVYGGRLGFGTPLTYGQSTALGGAMYSEFNRRGDFFNTEQQERIHKIGLSNEMMSARGGAGAGTVQQYKENFRKLKDTTAEIVKMMKTTIEGGMSIIKDMQNMGFGSLDDIRNQVKQVKALGSMSGIGTTNMTSVGFAGASYATNRNPYWRASVSAGAYQSGTASASYMAAGSSGAQQAVADVGGVANAGGILARTQMENLQGSIGTRMMSYAMNPDGSIDQDRLSNIISGNVSAYELVSGSNQRGYNMGAGGRAIFARNKRMALNAMSPERISRLNQRAFEMWGQGRGGTSEQQAWVYSGYKTSDPRSRELYFQSLINPAGFGQMYAHGEIVDRMKDPLYDVSNPWWGRRITNRAGEIISDVSTDLGQEIISPAFKGLNRFTGKVSDIWDASMGGIGRFVLQDPTYTHGDQGLGDRQRALNFAYGINKPMNIVRGIAAFNKSRAAGNTIGAVTATPLTGPLADFDITTLNRKELSNLGSMLTTYSFQNNPSEFFKKNSEIRQLINITNSEAIRFSKSGQADLTATALSYAYNQYISGSAKQYDMAQSKLDQWLADPNTTLSDKDKENQIYYAKTSIYGEQGDLGRFAPVVQQYVKAQKEYSVTQGLKLSRGRGFKRFDEEQYDKTLQGMYKGARLLNMRGFKKFVAGRDYTDPDVAEQMFEEYIDVAGKIKTPGYIPTERESEINTFGTTLKRTIGYYKAEEQMEQKDVASIQEYYKARTQNVLDEATISGLKISPIVKETLKKGYIEGNYKVLTKEFFTSNIEPIKKLFGGDLGEYSKLKDTKQFENLMFNSHQAVQHNQNFEIKEARRKELLLSNAIVSGKQEVDLSVNINKGGEAEKSESNIVEKKDYALMLQALGVITQNPSVTTDEYGKSSVVNAQPMVMNHWNNSWT